MSDPPVCKDRNLKYQLRERVDFATNERALTVCNRPPKYIRFDGYPTTLIPFVVCIRIHPHCLKDNLYINDRDAYILLGIQYQDIGNY